MKGYWPFLDLQLRIHNLIGSTTPGASLSVLLLAGTVARDMNVETGEVLFSCSYYYHYYQYSSAFYCSHCDEPTAISKQGMMQARDCKSNAFSMLRVAARGPKP